jgi:hypothetical protein
MRGYPETTAGGSISVTTSTWSSCRWCGCIHVGGGICPCVKTIKYYENGTVKWVEFHEQVPNFPIPVLSTPLRPVLNIRIRGDTKTVRDE